ncbi:hypothetical protein [Porphyromonas sp.]
MKKFLRTISALVVTIMNANAQLVLSPGGFISATDSTKNNIVMVVIGFPFMYLRSSHPTRPQ